MWQQHSDYQGPISTAQDLQKFLSLRAGTLFNADGSVHRQLDQLDEQTTQWAFGAQLSSADINVARTHDAPDAIYIVNCANLDRVSAQSLDDALSNDSAGTASSRVSRRLHKSCTASRNLV